MLESVSLYGAQSVPEIRERVKDFLIVHAGEGYGTREKWIRGVGWDQAFFGGVMPTAVCFPIQCHKTTDLYMKRRLRLFYEIGRVER
jgi:hypothetical protein